ncbi:MAG: glycosyltransferase family 1 protein [Candidatus Hydrogenedentota bacterium]|nr:MAG: glycosyltransferase family 1 protein [Candidatus Hydrogenedentota bacterium]
MRKTGSWKSARETREKWKRFRSRIWGITLQRCCAIDLRELRGVSAPPWGGRERRQAPRRGTGIGRWLRNVLSVRDQLAPEIRTLGIGRHLPGITTAVPGPRPPWTGINLNPLLKRESARLWFSPYFKFPPGIRVPAVITVHDTIPARYGVKRLLFRTRLKWSLKRAWKVCTVSHTTREELIREWNVKPERILLARNCVGREFHPQEQGGDAVVLERHGLSSRNYLLVVSDDRPHKNLKTIFSAFMETKGEPIVIVGSRRNDLPERFRVIPFLPENDLPVLYRHARVLLHPAFEEGFGLPPLEALASGTPVIVSDIPVMREVVGERGILLPPDNPGIWRNTVASFKPEPIDTAEILREFDPLESNRELWDCLRNALA